MPVLIINEFSGANQEVYEQMLATLEAPLKASPGFRMHSAGPIEGGWHVSEVWDSQEQHDAWIAGHVVAVMPEGMAPPTTRVYELANTFAV